MKVIIFLSLLTTICCATVKKQEYIGDGSWQLWKSFQNKEYNDLYEEKVRYAIWQNNLRKIEEHNSNSKSLFLKMNQFGDLTNTEFRFKMNGYLKGSMKIGTTFLAPHYLVAPKTVDWRTKGYVTPVKNQGQCGSCWAFSTTGSLEGQHFRKSGKLVNLSEQQLVDCSKKYGNNGCEGGLMDNAFKYIKANGGVDTEASYPYQGEDLKCRFKKGSIGADDTGFVDIPEGDEEALKNATASVGPISVAIDASHVSFQFYHSGVYDEEACNSEQLDHGVLVVGYGTDAGVDYWLVKNSWGETWGLEGYIKMSRNKKNQCGIATSASYPLV